MVLQRNSCWESEFDFRKLLEYSAVYANRRFHFRIAQYHRERLVIILCMAGSTVIEGVQLVTHRGLFEFDDIFHNTL